MMAAEKLRRAVRAALSTVGAGVADAGPIAGGFPRIELPGGSESDWGHKSGEGREVRMAVIVRDKGERPDRMMRVMGEAQAALDAITSIESGAVESGAVDGGANDGGADEGWRLVSWRRVASRSAREAGGWSGVIDYRARMLRDAG